MNHHRFQAYHSWWNAVAQLFRFAVIVAGSLATTVQAASLNIEALQRLVQDTPFTAESALAELGAALKEDPDNPQLLYNHAIAAYAAGHYDDALLSLDRTEVRGRSKLLRKARFQMGNAEYRLGLAAGTNNLDDTISHWKQSLDHYKAVLKQVPSDSASATNHAIVQRLLTQLLIDGAKKAEETGDKEQRNAEKRIGDYRNAHDKFDDAKQADTTSQEARDGEERTREKLANALAKEGARKANSPLSYKANRREPSLPMIDMEPIEQGVGMLQDANELKPKDAEIKKMLEQARQKLADAQTAQAQTYLALEERIPVPKEKLAVLRMGRESTQKALDQVPDHKGAQQAQEEIDRRLAKVHEDQGDMFSMMSEHQNLENQAMSLSQALDNYQNAGELKPEEQRLQQKAKKTQERLEQSLEKLGDKLMQGQQGESLEQQAARLEGAQQAFNELMGLNPSERAQQKGEDAGQQLEDVRGKLAQQGKPMPQPGGNNPMMAQMPPQQPSLDGLPMDSAPKLNTPGRRGMQQSATMLKGPDY